MPRSSKRARDGGKKADRNRKRKSAPSPSPSPPPSAGTVYCKPCPTEEDEDVPDYSSKSVWDKRYQDGVFVEWYCGLDHLLPLFERFIPEDSRVLDVGCGDKPLAWEMRDAGYTGQITSFDFSPTVIDKLVAEKRSCDRKKLDDGVEFRVLDARELPFAAGSFDLVVDKGTVDAMLCDKAGTDNARAICREAARVVAPGGWYMIVSHVHPSTEEGAVFLEEMLSPALNDSSSCVLPGKKSSGEGGKEGEDQDDADWEDYFWSVDVHCGGGGEEDDQGSGQEDEDSDGGSDAGGDEDGRSSGDDSSAGGAEGPSVYMARKMIRRRTRSSFARGRNEQEENIIPIRVHEY